MFQSTLERCKDTEMYTFYFKASIYSFAGKNNFLIKIIILCKYYLCFRVLLVYLGTILKVFKEHKSTQYPVCLKSFFEYLNYVIVKEY